MVHAGKELAKGQKIINLMICVFHCIIMQATCTYIVTVAISFPFIKTQIILECFFGNFLYMLINDTRTG